MQIDINKIKENPENPRKITEEQFDKLVNSIKEDPDILEAKPLVISDGYVKSWVDDDKTVHHEYVRSVDGEYYVLGGNQNLNVDYNSVDKEWEGMPEVNAQRVVGSIQSVIVHFETREAVEDFATLTGQKITEKTKSMWFPYKANEDVKSLIVENES